MKKLILTIIFIPFLQLAAQEIGTLAPEKEPVDFPDNAFGMDVMFSEGGFGLGAFYRHELTEKFTFFTDFSVSEAKDDNEFETYNYYTGQSFTFGKKNRIFLLPLNSGIQYRLFESVIHDNLRPYVNLGIGPSIIVTTPYSLEFFKSFGKAQAHYALGGYFGLGANFGLDQSSLIGINLRYYLIKFLGDGVESLHGKKKTDFGGFYLTINIGLMY